MKTSQLYRLLGVNLDLALEAHEVVRGEVGEEIPGVSLEEETFEDALVKTVNILESHGAEIMGKPIGKYVTIEADGLRDNNKITQKNISEVLAKKLKDILPLQNEDSSVLIVGLGNWNATPDALGPKVIDYTMATRHLWDHVPVELRQGLRSVSCIAPGVLGITGIETAEIIKGIVDRTKPSVVIAIDALAARDVVRINSTIQIADTGINPGSGVGNKRAGLNLETLGVPVVAIGVPTVVHAGIIAHQAIEGLFEHLKTSPTLYQIYKGLNPEAVQDIINSVLEPFSGHLMVTPKEIDDLIKNTSKCIAMGLASALHPAMPEEVANYLH